MFVGAMKLNPARLPAQLNGLLPLLHRMALPGEPQALV